MYANIFICNSDLIYNTFNTVEHFAAPVVAGTVEDPKNIAGTRGATGEQVDVRRH